MTSREFCYWLQGYFEIGMTNDGGLTTAQRKIIQAHLAMVFHHEIDPSLGTTEHRKDLQEIHDAGGKGGPDAVTNESLQKAVEELRNRAPAFESLQKAVEELRNRAPAFDPHHTPLTC